MWDWREFIAILGAVFAGYEPLLPLLQKRNEIGGIKWKRTHSK